jgi:hypothetical protein
VIKKACVMMLLTCPLWCHDASFSPPLVDLVLHFAPTFRWCPSVIPPAPAPVMLADAGAPTVLAGTPDAVMLADAGTPAVLADASLAVILLAPPLRCTHLLPSSFPPSSCLPLLTPHRRFPVKKIIKSVGTWREDSEEECCRNW